MLPMFASGSLQWRPITRASTAAPRRRIIHTTMKVWQQPLPRIYTELSEPDLRLRIQAAKDQLGSSLAILGHHFQHDAVIDFADFTGDSFELSRKAADQKGIDY